MLARAPDGCHGRFHIAGIVQGIKDAEHVHAVCRRTLDEGIHDIVRVMAVPNEILPAQEHLQAGVRHGPLERAQPFPWIFFQEAQAGIEGRASPGLKRPIAHFVEPFCDREQVLGSHPRREQGLMAIAERDVGQEQALGWRRF